MGLLDWLRNVMPRRGARANLQPEASYCVVVDGEAVSCTSPSGDATTIRFAELESVLVRTTDEGPLLPDVFWVLAGGGRTCVVPQGATGEPAMVDRLMNLPGFDHEVMTAAMCCADNREFVCWTR